MTNLPAIPAPAGISNVDGLEDSEASDLTMPIYRLDHERGCFVSTSTGEEFSEFDAILLGRLKQRILWPMDPSNDKEGPMCRSYDFSVGIPRAETWVQVQKKDPNKTAAKLSGFTFDQVTEAEMTGDGLSCATCSLKDWGENRTPPWCNEQWTFPFLRVMSDGSTVPGVISFQRTGLKACKAYVSGFVTAKAPLYTVQTKIKAVVTSKGSVTWAMPNFQRMGEVDSTQWPDLSRTLASIREYLTTPRAPQYAEDPDEAATKAAVAPQAAPKPAPAPTTDKVCSCGSYSLPGGTQVAVDGVLHSAVHPCAPAPAPAPVPAPAPQAAAAPVDTAATTDVTEQEATPPGRAAPVAAAPEPQVARPVAPGAPAADYDDEEEPF